jgi:hypothetical protein
MISKAFSISIILLLAGCTSLKDSGLDIKELGKSDMGRVYELIVAEQLVNTRSLMRRLYLRNPDELRKGGSGHTIESRLAQVFSNPPEWSVPELGGATSTEALTMAFSPNYYGDRVLAFTVGVGSMVAQSFNNHSEFYALDYIDAQKVYNSARNLELARWQLNNKRQPNGKLYLVSNELNPVNTNLGFDRLMTAMITQQDLVASVMMGKSGRVVNRTLQKMSTAIFLPI